MKLSIAVASKSAPLSAFVVWRGFEESIPKAAELGFHGIELALKSDDAIRKSILDRLLDKNSLEVSCISTGQVFSVSGLYFTHPDKEKRKELIETFKGFIYLAKNYGGFVNIGRARGFYSDTQTKNEVERIFIEIARVICDIAEPFEVKLLLEPVNRYETNFINTVEDGVRMLKKIKRDNIYLMPDVFHMNIEDPKIGATLAKYNFLIKYIHFADSNRMAPGKGHLDFAEIFSNLKKVSYNGWISVEILPKPDPDTAAGQAAKKLIPIIELYNTSKDQEEFNKKYLDD